MLFEPLEPDELAITKYTKNYLLINNSNEPLFFRNFLCGIYCKIFADALTCTLYTDISTQFWSEPPETCLLKVWWLKLIFLISNRITSYMNLHSLPLEQDILNERTVTKGKHTVLNVCAAGSAINHPLLKSILRFRISCNPERKHEQRTLFFFKWGTWILYFINTSNEGKHI